MSNLYSVPWSRRARKQFFDIQKRIVARLRQVQENPFQLPGKPLEGPSGFWSVRAGDYRVVYLPDPHLRRVFIDRIQHRKDVYRDL